MESLSTAEDPITCEKTDGSRQGRVFEGRGGFGARSLLLSFIFGFPWAFGFEVHEGPFLI